MTDKQPNALALADHLEQFRSFPDDLAAAAELRRLHAELVEADALRLQSALLGHKPQTDWDGIGIVAGVLLVVVMAVIVYAIGGAA